MEELYKKEKKKRKKKKPGPHVKVIIQNQALTQHFSKSKALPPILTCSACCL